MAIAVFSARRLFGSFGVPSCWQLLAILLCFKAALQFIPWLLCHALRGSFAVHRGYSAVRSGESAVHHGSFAVHIGDLLCLGWRDLSHLIIRAPTFKQFHAISSKSKHIPSCSIVDLILNKKCMFILFIDISRLDSDLHCFFLASYIQLGCLAPKCGFPASDLPLMNFGKIFWAFWRFSQHAAFCPHVPTASPGIFTCIQHTSCALSTSEIHDVECQ